jgi:hypothetical protein
MVKGAARPLVASQDVAHEKAVSATVAIRPVAVIAARIAVITVSWASSDG